jgi:hypothetical protein
LEVFIILLQAQFHMIAHIAQHVSQHCRSDSVYCLQNCFLDVIQRGDYHYSLFPSNDLTGKNLAELIQGNVVAK